MGLLPAYRTLLAHTTFVGKVTVCCGVAQSRAPDRRHSRFSRGGDCMKNAPHDTTQEQIYRLLDESIALERNVAALYRIFFETYDEDRDFWWQLSVEELNHASLLKSGRDIFLNVDAFPVEICANNLESLCAMNERIESLCNAYRDTPPSRLDAFAVAFQIEQSAGEFHYQQIMNSVSENKAVALAKKLNQDDRNHAERILGRMREQGLA